MLNYKNNQDSHAAKEEVLSASKETAATVALRTGKKNSFPLAGRFLKSRILFIAIFIVFIASIGAFSYFKLFAGSTYSSETIQIVEQVQELATLATAEAVVTTIIKEEDNKIFNKEINVNFPGTKRTILLIVPATVLAGVDLQSVNDKNIIIDENKRKITLTIPHATLIQEPSIQMDKVQTYSEEGLFRSEVNWDEGFDLAAKAQSELKKEAIELGLLSKAEESAVKIITNFVKNLGYETQIEFK